MHFAAITANCKYIDIVKVDDLLIDFQILKKISRPII